MRAWIRRQLGHERLRTAHNMYLDLLEKSLTGLILDDPGHLPSVTPTEPVAFDPLLRRLGMDWPARAQTMIGIPRLQHLRHSIAAVLNEGVPGDLIETGVWRGGACIYMRAMLKLRDVRDRRVWVADSFEGLPAPDLVNYPADRGDELHRVEVLAVSLEEVRANFARYDLLDEQVVFLKGFFKDTLPGAPIERLAILRLDGDMYESTMQALEALYDRVSPGGFITIDDFSLPNCRAAVEEFRGRRGIAAPLREIDGAASFWRKPA